jgi:hypothetical protein
VCSKCKLNPKWGAHERYNIKLVSCDYALIVPFVMLWNLEVGLLLNRFTISSSARSIWFLVFMKLWKLQRQCAKKRFYVHNPMLICFILSMVFFCDLIIERWILGAMCNVSHDLYITLEVHNHISGGHVLILVCLVFKFLCFVQSLFVCAILLWVDLETKTLGC